MLSYLTNWSQLRESNHAFDQSSTSSVNQGDAHKPVKRGERGWVRTSALARYKAVHIQNGLSLIAPGASDATILTTQFAPPSYPAHPPCRSPVHTPKLTN